MKTIKSIERKIHRKYETKHWWQKDYLSSYPIINQSYINKIFKKFNIKGKILNIPQIKEESNNLFVCEFGLIQTNLKNIINKKKFNKYVKYLELFNYNIYDENLIKNEDLI